MKNVHIENLLLQVYEEITYSKQELCFYFEVIAQIKKFIGCERK